jgi:hypothetical protein
MKMNAEIAPFPSQPVAKSRISARPVGNCPSARFQVETITSSKVSGWRLTSISSCTPPLPFGSGPRGVNPVVWNYPFNSQKIEKEQKTVWLLIFSEGEERRRSDCSPPDHNFTGESTVSNSIRSRRANPSKHPLSLFANCRTQHFR